MPAGHRHLDCPLGMFCFILSNVEGLALDIGKILLIDQMRFKYFGHIHPVGLDNKPARDDISNGANNPDVTRIRSVWTDCGKGL